MSENYQCRWCKETDEKVLEWTIYRQDWRGRVATGTIYAHRACHIKEMSTSGDGHGVRVTYHRYQEEKKKNGLC